MDRLITTNFLLSLIVLFIAGFILQFAQSIIITILIAALLAYIMDPLVALLKRIGVPLWLAVFITAVLFLSIFTGVGIIIYQSTLDFARAFPKYQQRFMKMLRDTLTRIQFITDSIGTANLLDELKSIPVGSIILSAVGSIAGFITDFFVVFLFSILILFGKYSLIRKLLRSFPRERGKRIAMILKHIDGGLGNYLGVKTFMSLIVGTVSGLCLFLFRVEFAILFGFLTFILNYIPYVGSIIAVIIPSLIALVQFGAFTKPLWIAFVLIIIQNAIGSLLEPKVMGERLNLSILVVFLSLLFWGWLWGAPGVLLAVPMTTSIKIVMENIPSYKSISLLLEKAPKRKTSKK